MPATTTTTELNLRKRLGRAHLEANHLEAALSVYASVARDYPSDPEAPVSLGDFYLAAGNAGMAQLLYQRAHGLNPRAAGLTGRMQLARAEGARTATPNLGTQWLAATEPAALNRVLDRLDGRQRGQQAAVARAAVILSAVAASPSPSQAVQPYLAELDALLPALLQLNVENAQAEGRPDLAAAIEDLRRTIESQPLPENPGPAEATAVITPQLTARVTPARPRLLLLEPEGGIANGAATPPESALENLGCRVTTAASLPPNYAETFDTLVVRHPHAAPGLLKAMAAFSALSKRVVVELDHDCEALPAEHPDYAALGLINNERATAYTAALRLADVICVPSEALAAALRGQGLPAQYLPPYWSKSQPPQAAPTPHDALHVGWIAGAGTPDDVAVARRALIILLHEFPDVRLLVAGHAAAYRLFADLPPGQTLFLPGTATEDEARALALCDIVLLPLRDTPFNRTLSDVRLLQAGLAGVPWVASPVPAYMNWQAGGLLATSPDEWYAQLRLLVVDAAERKRLAEMGRQQAETRQMAHWGRAWLSAMAGDDSDTASKPR